MALAWTPLDVLPDAARKAAAGPAPVKLMAARGLAPLKPVELVSALYMLALDADAAVKAAAEKTASELPDKILAGALADPSLDARVLDFFAAKVAGRPALLEAIVLNKATADETIRELAASVGEKEIDLIATNEERLLRHPAIIGAMYMNPKARMSTVDRAVELAVRAGITVPGIPSWEEVVAAVLGAPAPTPAEAAAADAAFAQAAAIGIGESQEAALVAEAVNDENATEDTVEQGKKKLDIARLSIPAKIRLATLGNAFARSILIRDSNKQVALAAIRAPGITDNEVVKFSANRALSDEVIRVIANSKEWLKLYQVKLNLVNNPKCPLPVAMRLLPLLHDKDLRNVAKSKGVPSALSAQAKKLVAQKTAK